MNTAWSIFKKDTRSSGIVVILWLAWICLQTGLGVWAPSTTGHPVLWYTYQIASLLGPMLQYLFLVILIPLVMHEDPLVDAKAFWLTRPISRKTLLMGKLVFIGLVVLLPVLLGEFAVLACNGVAFRHIPSALFEILLRLSSQLVVLTVLAALTANFARFAVVGISYLVAAGVVGFILTIFAASLRSIFMRHGTPPGDFEFMESMSLVQSRDVAAWAATILIGGFLLTWQFLTRKTSAAVVMALVGALCVAIISHIWPLDFLGGKGSEKDVYARGQAVDPESINLTIKNPQLKETVLFSSQKHMTLDAVISLPDVFQGRAVEIMRANITFMRTDKHTVNGHFMPQVYFQTEQSETVPPPPALWAAAKKALGEVILLHVDDNPVTTNVDLPVKFTITGMEHGKQSVGEQVDVTGEVDFDLYEYKQAGLTQLMKSGASLGADLCHDRILAVRHDAQVTEVRLRKQTVSLLFGGEKKSESSFTRMMKMPWSDLQYLLVNRKRSNEIMACESITPDDILFLMTLGLRMVDRAHPKRVDYVDFKLIFPEVSDEWLKDAELVCFKKAPLGSFKKKLDIKGFLLPKVESKLPTDRTR